MQVISLDLYLCSTREYSLQAPSPLRVEWRRVVQVSPAEEALFGCCCDGAGPWGQLGSSQCRARRDTGPSLSHQPCAFPWERTDARHYLCFCLPRTTTCCVTVRKEGCSAYNPAAKPRLPAPVCARLPPISNWEATCLTLIHEQIHSLFLLLFTSLDLKLL